MEEKHTLHISPQRILIKAGSAVLTKPPLGLDIEIIDSMARTISKLVDDGKEVLLVSSGAVSSGMWELGITVKPKSIPEKQMLAAIGQSRLMHTYGEAFDKYGKKVAQILLTRKDMEDRRRYLNVRNTIINLLKHKVIPIINENDTITVDELKFGDNDFLSSIIATKVGVDLFIILTNVKGVFSANPEYYKDAELLKTVKSITPEITAMCKKGASSLGSGGMVSKIVAANVATYAGIPTIIANGKKTTMLSDIFWGKFEGTLFLPEKQRRLSSRKRWIAFGKSGKQNKIVIDEGAKKALLEKGKSLLPVGIKNCCGKFEQGDVVTVVDENDSAIAKGLTNFSCEEVDKIKGLKSTEIEETLGYKHYDEVIHRDNMIIFDKGADFFNYQ